MGRSKTMSPQHVIDEEAQQLLRAILPSHWRLRAYQPDYGLDFTLELFQPPPESEGAPQGAFETLGEHLFIQLKGARQASRAKYPVYSRMNVERFGYEERPKKLVSEIDTLPISIEPTELLTVQRMGAGLPVLLVRADLDQHKCYFVCLNDYVDKILLPCHGKDALNHSRTVHIPALNDLGNPAIGHTAVKWYGKRPKLYAAFQKFIYQQAELAWCGENEVERRRLALHCANILLDYDFWHNTPMWKILDYYAAALRSFVKTGSPGLTHVNTGELDLYVEGDAEHKRYVLDWLASQEISQLWHGLTVLPRNYEELCREWFLPTGVGLHSTYTPGDIAFAT
jgi:hypothetical protein